MKCRTCGDSGTIVTVDPISGKKYEIKCPLCVAERKMTNEEWFNGLDTEKKAEFLRKITHDCYFCGYSYAAFGRCDNAECSFKNCVDIKEDWLEWLKSEHKE